MANQIVFRGWANSLGGSQTLTAVPGDLIILYLQTTSTTAAAVPAGYTDLGSWTNTTANLTIRACYRFQTSGGSTTLPPLTGMVNIMAEVYSGVSPSATFAFQGSNGATPAWSFGGTSSSLVSVCAIATGSINPGITGTNYFRSNTQSVTLRAEVGHFEPSATRVAEQASPAPSLTMSTSVSNTATAMVAVMNPTSAGYTPPLAQRAAMGFQVASSFLPQDVAVGDLILAVVFATVRTTPPDTVPSGFSLLANGTYNTGSQDWDCAVYWKIAGPSDVSSTHNVTAGGTGVQENFQWGGSNTNLTTFFTFQGTRTTAPNVSALGSATPGLSVTIPSVTGATGALLLTTGVDNAGNDSLTINNGASRVTLGLDPGKTAAPEAWGFLKALTASGATGTATVTGTQSVPRMGYNVAVLGPNQAPTAPTITAPNGGEIVNNSTTITWTAGTDPDGDALVYDLDYSADNGATWTSITTGVSGTSYAWNTSAVPSGTAYLVRARAKDPSGATSSYDQSNATFTIQHNVAPTAPTTLNPSGGATVDRTAVQRLSWTFTDPDAGDTQSKFDLQWRQGTGAWTTVTQTTPSSFYDAPASTFPAGSIEWQVRTYDAQGVVSPYSASAFFTAAAPPSTPSITSPTNGSTIGTQTGTIAWSAPSQDSYQVRKVADAAGSPDTATVYYDSGEVVSTTARNAALSYPVNGRYEHLQVRVKVSGIWSSWASVRVQVSYTPPATPVLTLSPSNALAAIVVLVTHPTPTGSQPAVSSTDIYRREVGNAATELRLSAAGGTNWTDYTPASGVAYEYRAVANGANGTSTTSAWTS